MSDIEIENKQTIPTYFLMQKLAEKYGDENEFHFIIGSDLISTLHLWHEGQKLIDEVRFVIYNRVGYDIEQYFSHPNMPKKYIYKTETKNIFGEVSSTEVRKRIAEGRANKSEESWPWDICGLVTKGVVDYIV